MSGPDRIGTEQVRLNRLIETLEEGRVGAGGGLVRAGDPDRTLALVDLDYDWVVFDAEHTGFEPAALRVSLQFLLSVAAQRPIAAPLVRIPAYGSDLDRSSWMAKQVLDQGAFGVVFPQIETVEQAAAAVASCRYPSRSEAAGDPSHTHRRGWWSLFAARYWGITGTDYYDRARVWPAEPGGEIIVVLIIESVAGVEALPRILREVPGVGAVWAGTGDLALSLGVGPDAGDPKVDKAARAILAACVEAGVPCCANVVSAQDARKRVEEGYRMTFSMARAVDPVPPEIRRAPSDANK